MERKDLFGEENKIAEEYDLLKMAIPHHDEFQEQVGKELLKEFNSLDQPTILELGSGTGLTTAEIVKAIPGAQITALDLEEGMQEQAKNKGISDSIKYVTGDALEYLKGLDDESFDSLVTAYTLHNFNNDYRKELVREIYRIIKSGGLFINADKIAHTDEEEYRKAYDEQISKYDVYDEIGKSDLKKEWVEHYAVDDQKEIRLVEGEFVALLKEAGFKEVNTVWRELLETVIVAKK